MSAWKRVGLRGRLALALAGVALLSVGLSMVLADSGLHSRLDQAARERLRAATGHTAQLAAGLYQQQHAWSAQTVTELSHVAAVSGYRVSLYDASGRVLAGPGHPSSPSARARVVTAGRQVGAVVLAPLQGQVLTGEDRQLQSRLNTLHLLAGAIALGAGLLAALLLAAPLARPLRRLTDAAKRIERGELDIRVRTTGPPETAALARAFNRLAETLEHEEQIRRAAAADVAHELRTPLTGIVSRIEAAQDGVLADQQRNLEAMHAEALRLAQLVDDLGKLADAEQPGLTVAKRDVDLAALAGERADAYRELIAAKGIALEPQLMPARAWGDPQRIAQIVDNLLSNALRYTEPGGRITVAVSQRDGEAIVEVADDGVGISGDDLPYIFERFWRAEQSRARKTGGAGIGLAIVRELVRAHDGRIDVQSKPGQGSRFTVILPAHPPSH
jgi:two-component system, OmpR family, sensor histidine kinase BaeS